MDKNYLPADAVSDDAHNRLNIKGFSAVVAKWWHIGRTENKRLFHKNAFNRCGLTTINQHRKVVYPLLLQLSATQAQPSQSIHFD